MSDLVQTLNSEELSEDGGGCCGGGKVPLSEDEPVTSKSLEEITDVIEEEGGGCCGGGASKEALEGSKDRLGSPSADEEQLDEDVPAGGCCGGDASKTSASGTMTMKSAATMTEEAGCCSCCGAEVDTGESRSRSRLVSGMSTALGSSSRVTSTAAAPTAVTSTPAAPTTAAPTTAAPTAVTSTPVAPTAVAEDDGIEIVLDEGMYFLYSKAIGGSTMIQFSRKGLPDAVVFSRFTDKSRIPAFKFKGIAQTPLSDTCQSSKYELYKGLCLYYKACKQYFTEPCYFNPGGCPISFEVLLLKSSGTSFEITIVQPGQFYSLNDYQIVVACNEGALSEKYTDGQSVAIQELTNAIIGAKAYRIEM